MYSSQVQQDGLKTSNQNRCKMWGGIAKKVEEKIQPLFSLSKFL